MKTQTPAEQQISKILAQHFPGIETFEAQGLDSLDVHEVDVVALKNAVATAFAAGRDFEGRLRDRRAERDEKAQQVTVDTSEYRKSHGSEPRGRGAWAFVFSWAEAKEGLVESAWFTPGSLLTFGEAKKLAVAEAQRRGSVVAYAMP
ncbi:MAG: hypothetical protein WAZ94_15070 [Phycisphaerales bacterium]|nr:hypothetical protein [Chloroflexota bacterium]